MIQLFILVLLWLTCTIPVTDTVTAKHQTYLLQ